MEFEKIKSAMLGWQGKLTLSEVASVVLQIYYEIMFDVILTELAPRPIQSISRNVCLRFV